MPNLPRSPLSSNLTTPSIGQSKSVSEPDLTGTPSSSQPIHKTPDNNITIRGKRLRGNESPNSDECRLYTRELSSFKTELMWMLSSWKTEIDQRLTTWKTEQDATLSTLVRDVNELKSQCIIIQKTNTDIETSMAFINQNYEDMKSKISLLEQEKCDSAKCIEQLEKQVQDFQYKARSASIELRNIPNRKDESADDLFSVLSNIGTIIGSTVTKTDLRDIYRLPGKGDSVRPIVAEFATVTKRTEFISAARKYNKELPKEEKLSSVTLGIPGGKKPIYVDDHLTPAQRKLLYETRLWAQPHNYKSWCSNGKVFIKMSAEGKPIHITSERCLANLSSQQ